VVGQVVSAALKSVRPNGWNPNRMTEFEVGAFRAGLQRNGWLAAYALLVWRTDENGAKQNKIIDGEHRWKTALDVGFTSGPMVFLDGLTEAQAKELTVALDNQRGKFDAPALRDVIKSLGQDPGLAFRLGFDDDSFKALMAPLVTIPPSDFRDVSIDAATTYCCPKCGYKWNGGTGAKKK
jgi:hypothetical protein